MERSDRAESPAGFVLPWRAPLIAGRLLRRRQRFLADVVLEDGREVVAHAANPGRMEGLILPGAPVWLEPTNDPARRLRYTWVAVQREGVWVGVDTLRPNALVKELLRARRLPSLGRYTDFVAEFAHAPGARVDFRLSTPVGAHDLEVKNCHLVYPDRRGYFPDSVSERAAKHLRIFEGEAARGARCTVLFVVQHEGAAAVRPSDVHDPRFAAAARDAGRAGVRFRALRVGVSMEGLTALGHIPVELGAYSTVRVRRWREENRATSGATSP